MTLTVGQTIYFVFRSRKDIAVSYRISVIGLPRSGKTALISAIFDHIFHSTAGEAFAPVGEKTIEKINNQIMLLDSRRTFGSTKDEDIFIFRFLYYVKAIFFIARVRYEGEVVDFPGEMSDSLMRSADDGSIKDDIALFNKEFYSWILSSKVHVFVVDLAKFFLSEDRGAFAASRAAEMRKTWQVLNEEINRVQRSSERRIALVFTKADLSYYVSEENGKPIFTPESLESIHQFGYEQAPLSSGDTLRNRISQNALESYVHTEFRSVITFFRGQKANFDVFFTSSYRDKDGDRLGVKELVNFVLPRSNVLS
ncbi:hypothetical protein SH591_12865 [Sphingomonas sp. LY54]|uniref:hypothetical protein n=1 Tax=Sphingomonas sp. LY54 TaxID=3095343 RepID=UPI002D799747|nr:hypothetical protein [Sphingomonas sp. LY54]WRP27988.1 hypothetical protein SH591_12865 [Sphingomonas sp. LY54]